LHSGQLATPLSPSQAERDGSEARESIGHLNDGSQLMQRLSQWVVGLALVLFASSASASPILVDGSWYEFSFNLAVSSAGGCVGCTPTSNPVAEQETFPPWTFSGAATLTIVDVFTPGDRFEAFDFGVSLGTTSVVPNIGFSACGGDIGCALADAAFSQLVVNLGPGPHSLTLNVIQNAGVSNGGAAVFQVSPVAVPEPGLLLLFGIGLAAAKLRRQRRARS
jgi:hypothetical protein